MQKIKGKKISYFLQKSIGKGSQGEVFDAVGDNQQIYAVKLQKQMHSDEEEFLQKMIEEQSSSKLIKIHEIFKHEEQTIIVQDFYESQNIKQLIEKMNKEDIKFVIQQVGEQLEYIHSFGYIYLDLKPENIIWRQNNQGQKEYKICDFGSIRKYRQIDSPHLPEHRGTRQYNPHDEKIDYSNDIWSFGALIYELHKKQQLFDGGEEVKDYFSYRSIQISDQIELLDISVTEKIFLSLMLEKNQMSRPIIQQVNQFYKNTQQEQQKQLLSLLDDQHQFQKQINFKIKQIEFDSIYGCDSYRKQNNTNNSLNQLIPYQLEVQQKSIKSLQKEMLVDQDRLTSNLEGSCINIQLAYYSSNNEESEMHPKTINYLQKGNYQSLTNFEEFSILIFELLKISQNQKIDLQDFMKNFQDLIKIEQLMEENNQKQIIIQQKKEQKQKEYERQKKEYEQNSKELKVNKEELDNQINQLKQMQNQVDSQKNELSNLKKNEKKMKQLIKEYEELKELETLMNHQENSYQKLKELKQKVDKNKTEFQQLKNMSKGFETEIKQYNDLIEKEQQVKDQSFKLQGLKSKESQMKQELNDYETLNNLAKKVKSQEQQYDQLLNQKEKLIEMNQEFQILNNLQTFQDYQSEIKLLKNNIEDLTNKNKKLKNKNKDLQKQINEMKKIEEIKEIEEVEEIEEKKEIKNFSNVMKEQTNSSKQPLSSTMQQKNGRKFVVKKNVFQNQQQYDRSGEQQQKLSQQNQIQPHNSIKQNQNNRLNNHRTLVPARY